MLIKRAFVQRCVAPLRTSSRCLVSAAYTSDTKQYFVTTHPGLEQVTANELKSSNIQAQNVSTGKSGVFFTGDTATCYRANLWLRSATRVLELLYETNLDETRLAGDTVYEAFRAAANWAELLPADQCFSVEGRVWGCTDLTSSQLLQVRARDAICDAIRDARREKPQPPPPGKTANLPLFATAFQDKLTIYRDTSGNSLHRRGYRGKLTKASLNESAAAGCLAMAGWSDLVNSSQDGIALADPMCGSGTFLIEAALMATNTAPGLYRRWWPFYQWPDFEQNTWRNEETRAIESRKKDSDLNVHIWGNDIHKGALILAQRDMEAAGVRSLIKLHHGECKDWQLPHAPNLVVSNPPWGQRLLGREFDDDERGSSRDGRDGGGEYNEGRRQQFPFERDSAGGSSSRELELAWKDLSTFLKRQAKGSQAYLLSGNSKATQALRLKAEEKTPVTVGGVNCRLLQYNIF